MRRFLLLAVAALALAGCGLQPMYAGGSSGAVARGLAAVEEPAIEGQAGWLVRNALVDRLGAGGTETPQYRLDVRLDDKLQGLGVLSDDTVGRERRTLRARYQLVAPMMPHLAEEAWAMIGQSGLVAQSDWPAVDPALLVDDEVTIAVQVNGKLRETMTVPRGLSRDDAEARALALPKVQSQLAGGNPRKVIVVPDRLVNIVA